VRLHQALAKLVEAEVLYQRGQPPQAHYLFKHALIQDAAYQSLLKSTRQQYHQQIAHVLEAQFADITETQPELLAHHYTEAGRIGQAIPYWQQAGQRAVERSAYVEAIAHLTKGLELLKTVPDTPARVQHELRLQIALGMPLITTKGYGAPEVENVYTRARELCGHVGDSSELFGTLLGLCRVYTTRAELQTGVELAERCFRLAQRAQSHDLLLEAHYALALTSFCIGHLARAHEHAERGIALYTPQHRSHAFLYGQDPGVTFRAYAARALWPLGYPTQAFNRTHEAMSLAYEVAHPFSLALGLIWMAELYQFRREGHTTQERAEAAIAFSTEQGFPLWAAWGTILRGWALAEQGRVAEGVAQIRHGLATFATTGAEIYRPYYLALLAEVYGKGGQTEEGVSAVAEALALVDKTGECWYEAELYRLKGELTLQSSVSNPHPPILHPQAEAEVCFLKAIDIARHQSAKSLELRAAMSLSRLWQQQGKKDEARQMLAEIYGWFTEGFDTKDLQEAKALLEELA
jgi:predicted ATPase